MDNRYHGYDAGELTALTDVTKIQLVRPEAKSILIYPKVDCYATFNGGTAQIFIPANCWTPVSIDINNFTIKAIKDSGKVYWQAWYV